MRAIDVHVHPSTRGLDHDAYSYFKRDLKNLPLTEEKFAALFMNQEVKAMLIAWHPSTVPAGPHITNEYAIELATRYPDGRGDQWHLPCTFKKEQVRGSVS